MNSWAIHSYEMQTDKGLTGWMSWEWTDRPLLSSHRKSSFQHFSHGCHKGLKYHWGKKKMRPHIPFRFPSRQARRHVSSSFVFKPTAHVDCIIFTSVQIAACKPSSGTFGFENKAAIVCFGSLIAPLGVLSKRCHRQSIPKRGKVTRANHAAAAPAINSATSQVSE